VKRWSPRQKALAKVSDETFRKGLPLYEQEAADMDYGDSLPEAEKIYLRNFTNEYYGSRFVSGERHIHDSAGKRECQRRQRSHAWDRHPDLMSYSPYSSRVGLQVIGTIPTAIDEDALIDGIDKKEYLKWIEQNARPIHFARTLHGRIARMKRQLRYLRLLRALSVKDRLVALKKEMHKDADNGADNWNPHQPSQGSN